MIEGETMIKIKELISNYRLEAHWTLEEDRWQIDQRNLHQFFFSFHQFKKLFLNKLMWIRSGLG